MSSGSCRPWWGRKAHEGQSCLPLTVPTPHPIAEHSCLVHSLGLWDLLPEFSPLYALFSTVQAQAGWLPQWLWASVILQHIYMEPQATSFCDLSPKGNPWQSVGLHAPLAHLNPSCFCEDPDINTQPFFFALGEILSEELGTWKKKYMLYNHQHKYFFSTEPPALLPLYFHWHIFYFIIQQKNWVDLP